MKGDTTQKVGIYLNLRDYLKTSGYEGQSIKEQVQNLNVPTLENTLKAIRLKSDRVRYEYPPHVYDKRKLRQVDLTNEGGAYWLPSFFGGGGNVMTIEHSLEREKA